jgi:hypothetical protein
LPILYAGAFFLIALFGYGCCSGVARLRKYSKQVFAGILAFWACSLVGFVVVILAVGFSPLRDSWPETFDPSSMRLLICSRVWLAAGSHSRS